MEPLAKPQAKPIAILQFSPTVEPGYFAEYLDAHGHRHTVLRIDQGEAVPAASTAFAGIGLLGGPMSANDALPWVAPVLDLIRDALSHEVPVIGHCLGGQLMAKALGAAVTRNPVREIGWGALRAEDSPAARSWLGDISEVRAYQWHNETFALPQGAQRVLTGDYCTNQAFVLGPHLGMQCHVEITPAMIDAWSADWFADVARLGPLPPSVQTPDAMRAELASSLAEMRQVSDRLYATWCLGLRH
ncbi:type 1 glutamine amidotransferase [Niveibacterium sp. SC-1]|uniref:type 1 glutamine amidotransferase n=1 Tax=Niveibacterium sp. SC-1 TaxID=3135646 RepID=UPI00311D5FB2